jgi:tetratricopeptide (TPR) repeat protein
MDIKKQKLAKMIISELRISWQVVFCLLFMILGSSFLIAQNIHTSKQGQLLSIDINKSEDKLEVNFMFSPFALYMKVVSQKPYELNIDLININEIKAKKRIVIEDFGVKAINVSLIEPEVVRVTFDLNEKVIPYSIYQLHNGIKVTFPSKKSKTEKEEVVQEQPLTERKLKSDEEEAIRDEMMEQWDKAIEIYKSILTEEPTRKDLWLRISDIEAHLNHPKAAAQAIEKAIELSPQDASLYYRLAQAYSIAQELELALEAIKKSLQLEPKNLTYLRDHASLAMWISDYKAAEGSFRQILSRVPGDNKALLGLARVLAWTGELDGAVNYYQKYINANPEDKSVLIEYVRVEFWRGNYPVSLKILEDYRKKFGEEDIYFQEKSRVLAMAMRPRAALSIIRPLLEKDVENYELNKIYTIALNNGYHLKGSLKSLDNVIRLKPDNPETVDTRLYVKTWRRPSITPGYNYYSDTSSLSINRRLLEGGFFCHSSTQLSAGLEIDRLNADLGSGLEQINGKEDAQHNHIWIGLNSRLFPSLGIYGHLGAAEAVDAAEDILTYRIGGDFWPSDGIRFNLERSYGFFVVSPRAVGLGLTRSMNQLRLQWEPGIRYHIETTFSYAALSDTNRFWEFVFTPRRIVARTENINLDLGVGAWLFGYRYDLNTGYYDPRFYQRYMITNYGYWKFSYNDGLSFVFTVGVQKDNNADRFRFSGTAEVEGTFGIYRDLMLKLNGGFFEIQLESGAHRAYAFKVWLTTRF